MLEITKPRQLVHIAEFKLSYSWKSDPGAGFGFNCTAEGERIPHPGSDHNYALCLAEVAKGKQSKIKFNGIMDLSRDYWEPAEGKCKCGATVYLEGDYGHGIDCDGCERIYNMSGQELAPRSQWEEPFDEDSTVPYNIEFGHADVD